MANEQNLKPANQGEVRNPEGRPKGMGFDFFSTDSQRSIKNEANGRATTAKTIFGKKVNLNKRNETFKEILSETSLPGPGEILSFKSAGTSDTGSIFQAMMDEFGQCDELNLSTWIIGRQHLEYLTQQVDDGNVKALHFIISIRQKELKKADYAFMIEEFSQRPQIKYRVCNSHAKTFCARFGEDHFTCVGSGNWTKNPRIEHYMILNDRTIFEHNRNWMLELL